jgi:C4-type Zn-finger protein
MIRVKISKDGKSTINVTDLKGSSCVEKTRLLEEALGNTEVRHFKTEYFEQELNTTTFCPLEFNNEDQN